MHDASLYNPGPEAPRSTAFHLLFDLRLLGIITIQGFHPLCQQATVGRRNLRDKIERAKLGGSVLRNGIKASALFKRTLPKTTATRFDNEAVVTCVSEMPQKQRGPTEE